VPAGVDLKALGCTGGKHRGCTGGKPRVEGRGHTAEVCRELGLNPWMGPSAEEIAQEFEIAPGRKQAKVLGAVFEAALWEGGSWGKLSKSEKVPTVQDSVIPSSTVGIGRRCSM